MKTAVTSLILASIDAYQFLARPWMPPCCRFAPSCSEFARTATQLHGARGLVLALRRLCRCHPFNPGGHDPVPGRFQFSYEAARRRQKHRAAAGNLHG